MSGLEKAHRNAVREQLASEQRLRHELRRWRDSHPEVMMVMKDDDDFAARLSPWRLPHSCTSDDIVVDSVVDALRCDVHGDDDNDDDDD